MRREHQRQEVSGPLLRLLQQGGRMTSQDRFGHEAQDFVRSTHRSFEGLLQMVLSITKDFFLSQVIESSSPSAGTATFQIGYDYPPFGHTHFYTPICFPSMDYDYFTPVGNSLSIMILAVILEPLFFLFLFFNLVLLSSFTATPSTSPSPSL